jgi:predicted PurR-regulated permease PerM
MIPDMPDAAEPIPPMPPPPAPPPPPAVEAATGAGTLFTPQLRFLVAAACVVVLIAGMRAVAPVLNTVLLALLVAQTMAPLMEWLIGRGIKPVVAATLTILVVLVFLGGVSTALGVGIANLTRNLPDYEAGLHALRDRLVAQVTSWGLDPSVISGDLVSPGRAVGWATGLVGWLANAFGDGFVTFFLASIILANLAEAVSHPERRGDAADPFMARVSAITVDVRPYLRITAVTGLIFSVIITAVLAVLGVKYAIVWGVLAFFMNFVPQVGIVLSWLPPAVLSMLSDGWVKALIVIGAYTVINFVIDNLIKPRFMAQGLNISFLAIILSLLFWGWVLGPAGAILSVPLTLAVRRFMQQLDAPPARALPTTTP